MTSSIARKGAEPPRMVENAFVPKSVPREWQMRALDGWVAANRHGIAAVVTGAGKTVFAQLCMADAVKHIPSLHFLILVPTQALLDQWYVSLQDDLNLSPRDIATYSGEGKPGNPALVNLIVLNTARQIAPRLTRNLPATMLIVDECHRAGSAENAKALRGGHAATLGLSATPEREYDDALNNVLIPALGPIIYEYSYAAAREDGVIAPFDLVNVRVPLARHEQEEYDLLSRKIGRLVRSLPASEHQLKRLLMRRASLSAGAAVRVPVAIKLVQEHPNSRTLIFHEKIDAAENIRAELHKLGYNVTIYHSKIPDAARRDNLRLFRRGVFDAMVSCRALDEGVNVPETGLAIIASSTATTRQRIQRLGRVLRPAPGKEKALIYTLYATDVEEQRLAREASSSSGASSVAWRRVSLTRDA